MKQVIKAPLVTEKNTYHNAAGVYVFEVDMKSTKTEIKASVEKNFKVKVDSVRTSVCRGHSKQTKFGLTKIPYWKKAYVKLVEGEKIALFEGV
ncbi:50S ribosomal protein L23 [Bdellovibrio bacteriovorus]|uniref:50S ribosomal protein L23 n=1 Tax=Bdellovibrio bacteriovorus TaxID=959 RepID=UPI0021D1A352|nr:50S ribosomal protein L23 [Bdellovibrio bacteriovorus]UXR64601.1 50S ribosomal protein L23 [Bdellovibrio bacteriovorus]